VSGIDRRSWSDRPESIALHRVDLRKRAAEDVFRRLRPQCVVHMATVSHLAAASEERYRINLEGTRAAFDYCQSHGVEHAIFVGRHTYYGAAPDAPLYHTEDEPPRGLERFPELADLVSADLYAGSALWRFPSLATTVLRMCYTLGPTGHGTLASFLRGAHVPSVLGYDPLFQFMHEHDAAAAIALAVERRPSGVYNVAGPQPLPLWVIAKHTGRTRVPLPERIFALALGRFGLPALPRGALSHLQYSVVIDASRFQQATGFAATVDEVECLRQFTQAFPRPTG
jgi:UDP-glucose 4-epimerase